MLIRGKRGIRLALRVSVVVLLSAGASAGAFERGPAPAPALWGQARSGIGPDQAAVIARSVTGGRILGVRGGGSVYEVKVLSPNGRVHVVRVDARTGAVLP